ncbi:hypothetical protein [Halorubellus litoreus]|uniref:Oligosaccharide repeat unit polymerase n=1 Tax=Halorubellus litoreus TaxID=755308 RepID=A0ABD5VGW5_9EURY
MGDGGDIQELFSPNHCGPHDIDTPQQEGTGAGTHHWTHVRQSGDTVSALIVARKQHAYAPVLEALIRISMLDGRLRRVALGFSLLAVLGLLAGVFPYPHYIFGTVALLAVNAYIMSRFSIVSIPSFVSVFLTYPALVPFITRYVYRAEHISLYYPSVESTALASKIVWLVVGLLSFYALTLVYVNERTDLGIGYLNRFDYTVEFDWVSFVVMASTFLGSAYLLAPGPTVFTIQYSEQASHMPSWATFAPNLFKGAWVVMFLLTLREKWTQKYWAFLVVSLLGTGWLMLHGRRVESIGIVALVFLDLTRNYYNLEDFDLIKSAKGVLLSATFGLYVFLLFLIGRIRNWIAPLLEQRNRAEPRGTTEQTTTQEATTTTEPTTTMTTTAETTEPVTTVSPDIVSTLQYGDGYVGVPGGAHSFYGTIRATVHLFDNEHDPLYGQTFLNYVLQAIPTPLQRLVGYTPPRTYSEFLATQYNYNGGNYFMNVYYANFKFLGVVLCAIVLAFLSLYMMRVLTGEEHGPTLSTGIGAILFIPLVRVLWYTQLNWVDSIQGFVLAGFIYLGARAITERLGLQSVASE